MRVQGFLFVCDGTLVHDVAHHGDADRLRPVPGARRALSAVRAAGGRIGVVTDRRGIALGLVRPSDVTAVRTRLERLLGPLPVLEFCPHDEGEGCTCRTPLPGLVLRAAARLGVAPERCVVIGDTGADMGAAQAAGMHGILVPTPATPPDEVERAPFVAPDVVRAVRLALDGLPGAPAERERGDGSGSGASTGA